MKISAYKGIVSIDEDSIQSTLLKEKLQELKAFVSDDEQYRKICIFIYLLCDLSSENPLVDRPFDSKKADALTVAFGSYQDGINFDALADGTPALKELVNAAITNYVQYENADEQKDINTYNTKMDQFRNMLHDMEPVIIKNDNERTGMITFSTNIDIINSVLSDIVSLIQAKASMIALYTTGIIPKHLRGGLSQLSKGSIKTYMPADFEATEGADDTDDT